MRSTYISIILPPWVDYSYFLFSSFLALSWNYVIKREVTVPLPREMVIYLTSSGHSFFVHSICRVSLFEKYILIILPYSIGYFCLSLSVFTGVIYLKYTPVFQPFHESMKSKGPCKSARMFLQRHYIRDKFKHCFFRKIYKFTKTISVSNIFLITPW